MEEKLWVMIFQIEAMEIIIKAEQVQGKATEKIIIQK